MFTSTKPSKVVLKQQEHYILLIIYNNVNTKKDNKRLYEENYDFVYQRSNFSIPKHSH